jgi:hypothetical protein
MYWRCEPPDTGCIGAPNFLGCVLTGLWNWGHGLIEFIVWLLTLFLITLLISGGFVILKYRILDFSKSSIFIPYHEFIARGQINQLPSLGFPPSGPIMPSGFWEMDGSFDRLIMDITKNLDVRYSPKSRPRSAQT